MTTAVGAIVLLTDVADLLDRAAIHIDRYGLIQGPTRRRPPAGLGPYRSAARVDDALWLGAGIEPGNRRWPSATAHVEAARNLLASYLVAQGHPDLKHPTVTISVWADSKDTTRPLALIALRATAQAARAIR